MTPTAGLIDQFNRANDTLIGTGWTEGGDFLGIDGTTLELNTNQVRNSSGSNSVARRSTTFGPDSEYYMDIPTLPGNGEWVGFFVRCTPTTNTNGYVVEVYNDGGSLDVYIFRVTSNGYTQLGAAVTNGVQAGDSLMIQAVGSSINIERQRSGTWSVIATRTDSTYNSAGYIGMYGTGTTFRLDNAGGGDYVASSAQNISAQAIASGETWYTPTVTPGAVTISANAIASGETWYAPVINNGAVTIATEVIASAEAWYQPTVTPGAVTVSANHIASGETWYTPTVSFSAQSISAPHIAPQSMIQLNGNGEDVNRIVIPLEDGDETQYPINVGFDQTVEIIINCLYANNSTQVTDARYSNPIADWDSWGDDWGRVLGVTRDGGANLVVIFGQAGELGDWDAILTTSNIGDGNDHHIALTHNSVTGVTRLWVDGVMEAEGVFPLTDWSYPAGYVNTEPLSKNNNALVIGMEKHDVGFGFVGRVDELRVSDIVRYTTTFVPPRYMGVDADTVALYRFDEGSGTAVRDSAGLNPDGVLLVGGDPVGPVWYGINTPIVYGPLVSHGPTTISANHIASAETWFTPIVTTGAVSINAPAIPTAEVWYQPTVAPDAVTVNANHIASGETWYQPTVTTGDVGISAQAIASGETWYQPTVTPGAVTVSANHIASSEAWFEPTVSLVDGDTVLAQAIASGEAWYQPTVTTGAVTVSAQHISSGEAWYTPVVSAGAVTVSGQHIASGEQWYQPTVTPGAVTVSAGHIATGETWYAPIVSDSDAQLVSANAIASAEVWYQPVVTPGAVSINAQAIASAETWHTARVDHQLAGQHIASAEVWYTPTLSVGAVTLSAQHIASGEVWYTPVISGGALPPVTIASIVITAVTSPLVNVSVVDNPYVEIEAL